MKLHRDSEGAWRARDDIGQLVHKPKKPIPDEILKKLYKEYNFQEVEKQEDDPAVGIPMVRLPDHRANPRKITPSYVRSHPSTLFVFGDNDQRKGTGGQAVIRDEPNTIGFRTKKAPRTSASAYYVDSEYDENVSKMKADLKEISRRSLEYDEVYYIPGIGEGRAMLKEKAPKTYAWMKQNLPPNNPPLINPAEDEYPTEWEVKARIELPDEVPWGRELTLQYWQMKDQDGVPKYALWWTIDDDPKQLVGRLEWIVITKEQPGIYPLMVDPRAGLDEGHGVTSIEHLLVSPTLAGFGLANHLLAVFMEIEGHRTSSVLAGDTYGIGESLGMETDLERLIKFYEKFGYVVDQKATKEAAMPGHAMLTYKASRQNPAWPKESQNNPYVLMTEPWTGEEVMIDEDIANLIQLMWDKGIQTINSNQPDERGVGYIAFKGSAEPLMEVLPNLKAYEPKSSVTIDGKGQGVGFGWPPEMKDDLRKQGYVLMTNVAKGTFKGRPYMEEMWDTDYILWFIGGAQEMIESFFTDPSSREHNWARETRDNPRHSFVSEDEDEALGIFNEYLEAGE